MNRREWQREFTKLWGQRTIRFTPERLQKWLESVDLEDTELFYQMKRHSDNNAPDWSLTNRWIDTVDHVHSDERAAKALREATSYGFGSPYRKEVYPDDNLGTYQANYFCMQDGRVTCVHDNYGTGCFLRAISIPPTEDNDMPVLFRAAKSGPNNGTYLHAGLDVYELFPNPADAVSHFYHETGMCY